MMVLISTREAHCVLLKKQGSAPLRNGRRICFGVAGDFVIGSNPLPVVGLSAQASCCSRSARRSFGLSLPRREKRFTGSLLSRGFESVLNKNQRGVCKTAYTSLVPVVGLSDQASCCSRSARRSFGLSLPRREKRFTGSLLSRGFESILNKNQRGRHKTASTSLVPVVGLEPTRYRYQRILSPSRLPIPSHRLREIF